MIFKYTNFFISNLFVFISKRTLVHAMIILGRVFDEIALTRTCQSFASNRAIIQRHLEFPYSLFSAWFDSFVSIGRKIAAVRPPEVSEQTADRSILSRDKQSISSNRRFTFLRNTCKPSHRGGQCR